jgi:hypothetical protein
VVTAAAAAAAAANDIDCKYNINDELCCRWPQAEEIESYCLGHKEYKPLISKQKPS